MMFVFARVRDTNIRKMINLENISEFEFDEDNRKIKVLFSDGTIRELVNEDFEGVRDRLMHELRDPDVDIELEMLW